MGQPQGISIQWEQTTAHAAEQMFRTQPSLSPMLSSTHCSMNQDYWLLSSIISPSGADGMRTVLKLIRYAPINIGTKLG